MTRREYWARWLWFFLMAVASGAAVCLIVSGVWYAFFRDLP